MPQQDRSAGGKTTFGAEAKRLAALLRLGAEGEHSGAAAGDAEKERVLRAVLASPLPTDPDTIATLGALAEAPHGLPGTAPGPSLSEALLDSHTDVDTLRAVHRLGKRLAARNATAPEHAAATVLYYAAIAAAIVFHGQVITKYHYKNLDSSFTMLVAETWIPPELVDLYFQARDTCRERAEGGA